MMRGKWGASVEVLRVAATVFVPFEGVEGWWYCRMDGIGVMVSYM
jgi:hypothetical protein